MNADGRLRNRSWHYSGAERRHRARDNPKRNLKSEASNVASGVLAILAPVVTVIAQLRRQEPAST